MNERITEDLVRDHFKQDPLFDQVNLEEQRSTKDRLKALFSCAAKSGSGEPGFPEFIISFPARNDLLIVVECKSDTLKHRSRAGKDAANFAVDGILHYMQCANAKTIAFMTPVVAPEGF